MQTVYLAGPIAGLSYEGATEWRTAAADMLEVVSYGGLTGVKTLSPLRAKDYLPKDKPLTNEDIDKYAAISVLSSPRGIMCRDHNDATTCDVMLIYLFGAKKISVGTVMELAWAYQNRTPVVCVMEAGNVHEHPMVAEAIDFRVDTLDEAVKVVKSILG